MKGVIHLGFVGLVGLSYDKGFSILLWVKHVPVQ